MKFLLLFLFSLTAFSYVPSNEKTVEADNLTVLDSNFVTVLEPLELEKEAISQHILTPSNPAAGFLKVYAKADDFLYILNSAGTERKLGIVDLTSSNDNKMTRTVGTGADAIEEVNIEVDDDDNLLMLGTGAIGVPDGTTAQRPSPASAGMFRFNVDNSEFEGYDGTSWGEIGGAGGGAVDDQTNFTILDNQTDTNLVGFTFDSSDVKGVVISFDLFRRDDTQSAKETGKLFLSYDSEGATWLTPVVSSHFGDAGVTFGMDGTGQVTYTSTNFGGAGYSGSLRVKNIVELSLTASSNFAINNNATGQSLTGIIFDKSTTSAVILAVDMFRRTDDFNYKETGRVFLTVDEENDVWLTPVLNSHFDDAGVTFNINATTGQLSIDTANITGANYDSKLLIRSIVEMEI